MLSNTKSSSSDKAPSRTSRSLNNTNTNSHNTSRSHQSAHNSSRHSSKHSSKHTTSQHEVTNNTIELQDSTNQDLDNSMQNAYDGLPDSISQINLNLEENDDLEVDDDHEAPDVTLENINEGETIYLPVPFKNFHLINCSLI